MHNTIIGGQDMRIAINGFGRIGKTFLRTILLDSNAAQKIDVVTINIGKANMALVAHSFKYDTLMGTFPGDVHVEDNKLFVGGKQIEIITELDPRNIQWGARSIDWVVDATGDFTKRDKAMLHIEAAGAQHVLITAPAEGADATIVPGVNNSAYDKKKDRIVSIGSCTTNALVPMLKVLDDAFKITQCMMTTVHAYTNNQVLWTLKPAIHANRVLQLLILFQQRPEFVQSLMQCCPAWGLDLAACHYAFL